MKKLISFASILALGLIMTVAPVNNSYAQNSGSTAGKVSFGLAPTNFLNKNTAETQDEKDKALLDAAKKGDLPALQVAIKEGGNINTIDEFWTELPFIGYTPLIVAAYYGYVEIVEELLKTPGIDINAEAAATNETGDVGKTALDWAIDQGRAEVARALNAKNAPLGVKTAEDYKKLTNEDYWNATTTQTTQSTTTTNQTQDEKDKALFRAAKRGDLPALQVAIKEGGNINTIDEFWTELPFIGYTPLIVAAYYGYVEIVEELLKTPGIDINAEAAATNETGDVGKTALDEAIVEGHADMARALNAKSAPLNKKTPEDYKALTNEDYWNATSITEEKKAEDKEVEKTAIVEKPAGCSPSQKITGDKDSKQYIYHNTALYTQSLGFNCSNECDGAIVNMGNGGSGEYHFGGTKIQKSDCKIDKYTCKNNVWTKTSADAPWVAPIKVEVLSAYQTNCNGAMTSADYTAQLLTAVAANGDNVDAVRALIEAGANKNAVDAKGNTALDLAIINNNAKIAQYLKSIGAVQKNTTAARYNALITTLKTVKEEGSTDDAAARALQQQIARVESISAKINATVGALDVSVWRNEEGKFNTSRLLSDSIAGVVLGTAGGLITSSVMKKSQVEKGYENIGCTVGNQSVANWGDEFVIGMTIAR